MLIIMLIKFDEGDMLLPRRVDWPNGLASFMDLPKSVLCRGTTLAVDHVSMNSRFFELDALIEFDQMHSMRIYSLKDCIYIIVCYSILYHC